MNIRLCKIKDKDIFAFECARVNFMHDLSTVLNWSAYLAIFVILLLIHYCSYSFPIEGYQGL